MSPDTFDPDWLALREPVDHRSRSGTLVSRLADWWTRNSRSTVLDLGSGTGSNLRYLAPRLSGPQTWQLIDHDAALLDRVRARSGDIVVRAMVGDLGDAGLSAIGHAHLVTASALLDLVSGAWLEAVADACHDASNGALFALTYDGSIEWGANVGDPLDELIRRAVNAHQRRDKGLGAALGPTAVPFAEKAFRRRGFHTWLFASPWRLGPEDTDLVGALVAGWAKAAAEELPEEAERIGEWAERRRAIASRDEFELIVGHADLLALPATQV